MPLVKQRGFKFSILCDVFLLFILAVAVRTIEIVPGVFSDRDLIVRSSPFNQSESDSFRLSKRFDAYNDFTRIPYDTIHRILRDEEDAYRSEDQRVHHRWKKATATESADRPKRETHRNPNSSKNSTKSIDLVNRNLTKFVFDSDLEMHLQQSDKLQAIIRLNLTGNRICEFDTNRIERLSNIQSLDLSQNNLTKFVLGANSTVKYLNLSVNRVSDFIAEFHDAKLNILSLHRNNIVSSNESEGRIDLRAIIKLETLDLSCNEIYQVNRKLIGHGRALKLLNLAHNRLEHIDKDTFNNLMNIDTLVLSYNNISTIDPETFRQLPNLQYLDLSYNNIRSESIHSLQGLPDLVGLSIAHNPDLGDSLQDFVTSWSLKEIDASGTGLCRIPAALAQSVRTLKLIENSFEVIRCGDLDSYPLLQYLDLSQSHVSEIEDDALGRLEILQTLFLDHNNLKKIPISLPTSLEHLFLHNNEIMDIQPQTLQQLTNLKTLDLSRNKLTYVPGLPLPKLLVLNLQSSELRGLSQSIVKTSPKLRDLLLDGNPIKCTELMGIAEWATPCQNDRMPAKLKDVKRRFIEMHNYLNGFPVVHQNCPEIHGKTPIESRIQPLCSVAAYPSRKDDAQSNKLESQFRKTTEKELSSASNPKIYPNHTEDIENSIRIPPPSPPSPPPVPHKTYDDQSGNSLTVNSISGKAVIIANSQSLSAVPNDIKIHDRPINNPGNVLSRKAKKNRANKANVGVVDAKSSMPTIGSQLSSSSSGSNAMFTKNKKNMKQQKQQGLQDIIFSKMKTSEGAEILPTIETFAPSSEQVPETTSNGGLNTSEPEAPNGIAARHDKLDPSELSLSVQKVVVIPSIPKNDSNSDKIRATKRMMLATLHEQTTTHQPIRSTFPTTSSAHNRLNSKTILSSALVFSISTTDVPPSATGRPSRMFPSKVNKADKVVDQQPSAINENGIIKRNQTGPYFEYRQGAREEISSDSEKLQRQLQLPKLLTSLLQGSKRYNQDDSQQKQPPLLPVISATISTAPAESTTAMAKKADKVKADKYLKFSGEKNLNVTVLTYTKEHIHKTINKDIVQHHSTTITYPLSFIFDVDMKTTVGTPSNNSHSNIPTNQFKGENHFKVNTNRVSPLITNDDHLNGDKNTQTHPQLNALHALASPHHLNASNSSNGLPPEQWLDIRTATGHPGLFIVIGLTIGMVFTLGLIHIYRCRRPWRDHLHPSHNQLYHRSCPKNYSSANRTSIIRQGHSSTHQSNYNCDEDEGYYIEPDQNRSRSSTRRDFLPMELLRPNAGHHHTENIQPIW